MLRIANYFLIPVVFFVVCSFPVGAYAVLVQWIDGNGNCYEARAVEGGINWQDAQNLAVAAGGYLVTITSAAENDFVFTLIQDPSFWNTGPSIHLGPWMGGFQPPSSPEPAGGWQWVTGESFSYTNWLGGEPNNNGNEDALHYFVQGSSTAFGKGWNDISRDDPRLIAYVLEINASDCALPVDESTWGRIKIHFE